MSVIQVNNIHKKFKVYHDKGQTFKEKILFRNRNYYEDREVLKGISLEVEEGEAIGLIGENGCGKSTLLKLLTKIMYPDDGSIEIKGRVSSLIELGAGFHPDMSGRENIYTNASIFGLSKKEIDNRLKDIIEFSELEEFIDNPVRTYSSGMYMRLAFSVAINVDADVLLIDEILAVGDASFQAKCFNRLREIKNSGTTIVIVSHSLGQIEQICERSLWIDNGAIRMEGKPRDVHPYYLDFMGRKYSKTVPSDTIFNEVIKENNDMKNEDKNTVDILKKTNNINQEEKNRWGSKEAKIIEVKLYDNDKNETNIYRTGDKMIIEINYETDKKIEEPVIGIGIFRNDGTQCYGTNTNIDRINNVLLKSDGIINCIIKNNNLITGEYKLDVAIHTRDGFDYDYCKGIKTFRMYSDVQDVGVTRLTHEWKFQ